MSVSKMTGIFLPDRDVESAAGAPDVIAKRKIARRAIQAIVVLDSKFGDILIPLIVWLLNLKVLTVNSRANIM